MNNYEKYKPSGIDWIGEVPEHWATLRIKNVTSIMNGSTPSSSVEEYWDGDIIWVTPGDFNKYDKIIDDSESKITEAGYKSCGTSLVPVGSVIITTRASIGNVLIAGKDLCTNQGCKTLIPNRIENRFLYYVFSISTIQLNILGQGTTFLELSKESLGTFKIPIPDYDEQLTIANYLDHQTQKIDRLIANKKAQAEKLKELRRIDINNAVTKGLNPKTEMKDSGIEWLGKIPKHWAVKHLKRAFKFYNNLRIPLSSEERADLDNIYDYYGASGVIDKVDKYLFDGNYILIGEDGANLVYRNTPLAFKASGKFWVNNHAHILQPINGNIDYNTFLLESIDYSVYISGSAQPKLTIEALSSMRVIVPPKGEQTEIANYLQQRTASLDQLIRNIELQIEKLQELRKITIYEAVTGKIKINAYGETAA